MINANEYETREDLEKAMYQMRRDQLVQLIHSKYGMIKSDIINITTVLSDTLGQMNSDLDKHTIYLTADCIEVLAKHLALTCSIMKSSCRLIPDDLKEKEDANRSTASISKSN